MTYELFAVIGIIVCLFLLALEYLWLYILAVKQEKHTNKYSAARKKAKKIVEGIMFSPTRRSRESELKSLNDLVNGDCEILDAVYEEVNKWKNQTDDFTKSREGIFVEIDNTLKPIEIYAKLLNDGNLHDKCYACRRLADFKAVDYINDIGKLVTDKSRTTAYNAAMALSVFGDCERVAKYIVSLEDDKKFSTRVVYEIIADYGGDLTELVGLVLKNCNESMKATIITAVASYGLNDFADVYYAGVTSTNEDMKIACVKALSGLKNLEYEHALIVAAKDKNWVVRIAAIKGLSAFQTRESVDAVKIATKDKEWWVRQVAASALLNMSVKIKDIDEIMKGYDRYAADAVKNSLYREIDMRG